MIDDDKKIGIKNRLIWLIDILTRFDYKFYTDQNVLELKHALNSYYAMANEYPEVILEIIKSEGFDYQDFTNGVLKEAQVFIYKYDLKFKEEEKTAKI